MFSKRGQLFLVAALVISGILIGLAALYTSTQAPKEDKFVYDLSSELNYETAQVIDQAVFTSLSQDDINNQINNLTNYYVDSNPGSDIIIAYGNDTEITAKWYTWGSAGTASVGTAGVPQYGLQVRNQTFHITSSSDEVTLQLTPTISQTFRITRGQNFISVIKKTYSNQTYVATGGGAASG